MPVDLSWVERHPHEERDGEYRGLRSRALVHDMVRELRAWRVPPLPASCMHRPEMPGNIVGQP